MIVGAALCCVALFVLFEVRLRPEFSLPREREQADPEQEARYEECVDARTDQATRQAFEAADNPDVQSLMIRMQQQQALEDCRHDYPWRTVTISEPLHINLLDLAFRFDGQRGQPRP